MFGPISTDGVENVRFYEKLCLSDPAFASRPEARIFLERCAKECTSAAVWIHYNLFLLLIHLGDLETALATRKRLIDAPELPKIAVRWVELVASTALLELGRHREALQTILRVYLKFRDLPLLGEVHKILRSINTQIEDFRSLTDTAATDSALLAALTEALEITDLPINWPTICSDEMLATYHFSSLPPVAINLGQVRNLNTPTMQLPALDSPRNMREISVYRIPNATVSFDCCSVGVFDGNGEYVEPVSSGVGGGGLTPGAEVLELRGNVALISDCFVTSNICHWVYDTLSRINYIRSGFSERVDYWIVPSVNAHFINASVEAFGIDPASLVSLEDAPRISVANLITTSSSRFSEHPARHGWRENIEHLRLHLLPLSKRAATPRSPHRRRILVSRADAGGRRMIGEEVLAKILIDTFGFEVVSPGQLSFPEQISLFSQADIVVGPHGAGLTNIIFCEPGSLVIEIFPPLYFTDSYSVIARSLGHDYASVYCCPPELSTVDDRQAAFILSRSTTAGQQNFTILEEHIRLIEGYISEYVRRGGSPQHHGLRNCGDTSTSQPAAEK
jgi:hypothetical protein